jgi:hypothetical protein
LAAPDPTGAAVSLSEAGEPLSDFEQGEIGPDFFRHACLMGLERLVSNGIQEVFGMISISHWGLFPVQRRHLSPAWYQAQRDGTAWEIVFG